MDEYKRELTRVSEAIAQLNEDYVKRMRLQQRRAAAAAAATAAGAGMLAPIDEAALLDVTAEMEAAGFTSSAAAGAASGAQPVSAASARPPLGFVPGVVAAVKDEADAVLAEYADVLASRGSSRVSTA